MLNVAILITAISTFNMTIVKKAGCTLCENENLYFADLVQDMQVYLYLIKRPIKKINW